MYIFHLANSKLIKLEDSHIICKWSQEIQKTKEKEIFLKDIFSDEFKMLIRVMELIMTSENQDSFIRKIKILSQLSDKDILKKTLLLMYKLEIVPPEGLTVISKIQFGGSLADIIRPIFADPYQIEKFAYGKDVPLSVNETISLMLYNQHLDDKST